MKTKPKKRLWVAAVSAGTYLVRGTVSVNGKREKVSLVVGVR